MKLQGLAGSHTCPARPPEAKLRRTAGGARLPRFHLLLGDEHIFWGASRDKEEPPVVTEIGA
jgi:hypothetical protein